MNLPFSQKVLAALIFTVLGVVVILLVLTFKPNLSSNLAFNFSGKPRPGSCLILEEKYCKGAKFVPSPGDPNKLVPAYELPRGTAIFSPIDGNSSQTPVFVFKDNIGKEITYPGTTVTTSGTTFAFMYFKDDQGKQEAGDIRKGQVLGRVSDRKLDFFGKYNLVVGVTQDVDIRNLLKIKD